MSDEELTPAEKITATKIKMSDIAPFFSYIVEHLTFEPKENMPMPTIGVDSRGHCVYDPKYMAGRNSDGLVFDLSHEAMHVALQHCLKDRVGSRDPKLWNIAVDLVVNNFMIDSGLYIAEEGLIKPDTFGEWSFIGKAGKKYTIDDISNKTAEDVYAFIEKNVDTQNVARLGRSKDNHFVTDKNDGAGGQQSDEKAGNSEDEGSSTIDDLGEKDWQSILAEAAEFARNKGNTSKGIARIVEMSLKSKRNWKRMLNKYVMAHMPSDYTYMRPSKRFISTGMYFPSVKKESINVAVAIDSSGSIGKEELSMFLGEIHNILSSFNNIQLTYIVHDYKILKTSKYTHKNLHMLKDEKMLGGGGTSHVDVLEWADKNKPEMLICFTDGYNDISECKKYKRTIWMLTEKDDNNQIKFGQKIFFDKHLN